MGWYVRVPNRNSPAPRKKTAKGLMVHSYATLLSYLTTIAAGRITPTEAGLEGFTLVTKPRRPQRRAPELLRVTHKLGYA